MFDIGWTEMLVVGVVAILFVGPRELPGMLRTAGQMVRKVRGMAGDFQQQMDDALREAELDGLKDSVDQVRKLNPTTALKDSLNPLKSDLEKTQAEISDATKPDKKFSTDHFRKPTTTPKTPETDGAAVNGDASASDSAAKPDGSAEMKAAPAAAEDASAGNAPT